MEVPAEQQGSKRLLFLFNKEDRTELEEQELSTLRQESLDEQLKYDQAGELDNPGGDFPKEDGNTNLT